MSASAPAAQVLPGLPSSPDSPPHRASGDVPTQEIFIPVWGEVVLSGAEMAIIDHPAFARLADINQLGQTHLVFRGATHKRWEHAVGTLHAAQLMVDAVHHAVDIRTARGVGRRGRRAQWINAGKFHEHEVTLLRLAALLHDIGHISAGHTLEDELGLLSRHDRDARINFVLDRTMWRGAQEPSLRSLIDGPFEEVAGATLTGLSASELLLELVSKDRLEKSRIRELSPALRLAACRDLVGNTICADLLDYSHRDWHHIGKIRPVDTRLLGYFELMHHVETPLDVRLVVNLRGGAQVRRDAVTAIFEMLEVRFQLGEIALAHRTKLTASAMLERLINEVQSATSDRDWFSGLLDRFLECNDDELVDLTSIFRRAGLGRCDGLRITVLV